LSIRKLLGAPAHPVAGDVALLVMRVVVGLAFMIHGFGKIQNPLSWMGPDSTVPRLFQALAAISEFGGGLAWILGLLTPLASLGILCTMAVASHLLAITRGEPFVSRSGGSSYELAVVYLAVSLVLLALGPGGFSLDRKLFGRR
jgi:putative oxidoreductase